MSGIATAVVVGGVGSAVIGSMASSKAAGQEADAANNSTAAQLSMFNTEQANEAPYMAAGSTALTQLQGQLPSLNNPFTMAQFQEDPGYQFDLQQGQQAIQNSSAASGHMVSSQELGNASNYSQNMASNEFGNAFNRYQTQNQNTYNRLMGMVQVGQAGASNTNAAAQNTANNISASQIGAGNAAAASTVGTANAISGGVSSIGSGLANYGMMSNLMPQNQPLGVPNIGGGSSQFTQPQLGSSAGYGSGANLLASY